MAMKVAVAEDSLQTRIMDHHGLVAAACQDLGIEEKINRRIGSSDPRRAVQPGKAVVAMILNGLGFTSHRLYLTPQFFESKAVDVLFDADTKASDFTDKTLGKALDEISGYGETRLFGELAFEVCDEQDLFGELAHLDTTSFSLEGQYDAEESCQIQVKHGFSKDHRPDLKQVMLSLTVTGDASIPLWMEALDGNSSDKVNFHETITRVRQFQSQLSEEKDFIWVADSALYTPDSLLKHKGLQWVTRVPETIKCCRELAEQKEDVFEWMDVGDGYRLTEQRSDYGEIPQRWVMVYSQQAFERERKTLMKRINKEKEKLEKACWHASSQSYGCEKDALKVIADLNRKQKYHTVSGSVEGIMKYAAKGRPGPDAEKVIKGYQLTCTIEEDHDSIGRTLRRKGRFILATNNLDNETLPATRILADYKKQSGAESGFRFIKDPWFMVDSFYVKKPERLSALMMVMALCLMVYNYAQYTIRRRLNESVETLPNQKGKPVQNPTLKWIFQLMEGVSIIYLRDAAGEVIQRMVTNVNETRLKIVRLLGESAKLIYGVA